MVDGAGVAGPAAMIITMVIMIENRPLRWFRGSLE
jgi:hypothetical protein